MRVASYLIALPLLGAPYAHGMNLEFLPDASMVCASKQIKTVSGLVTDWLCNSIAYAQDRDTGNIHRCDYWSQDLALNGGFYKSVGRRVTCRIYIAVSPNSAYDTLASFLPMEKAIPGYQAEPNTFVFPRLWRASRDGSLITGCAAAVIFDPNTTGIGNQNVQCAQGSADKATKVDEFVPKQIDPLNP